MPIYFLEGLEKFVERSSYKIVNDAREIANIGSSWNLAVRLPSIYHLRHKPLSSNKSIQIPTINDILIKQKELIRLHKPKIILDMGIECFFARAELFIALHSLAEELEIPCKNIAILESGLNTNIKYLEFCLENQIYDYANFVHYMPGGWQFCESYLDGESNRVKNKLLASSRGVLDKSKLFVSMNGRIRDHRLLLCIYLFTKGYISKSYVSLLLYGADRNFTEVQITNIEQMLFRLNINQNLKEEIKHFLGTLPLELDVKVSELADSEVYTNKMVLNLASHEYFDDAFFNLVTETLFFDDNAFLVTEKSFKAFATSNPFILFAHCGTLKFMRDLGFMSFGSIINEEYDFEEDGFLRMRLAFDEIDRLANLAPSAVEVMLRDANNAYEENNFFLKERLWDVLQKHFKDGVIAHLEPSFREV